MRETDVADKNKKVLYQPLYEVYAKSDSYAKYIGADEFYVRYSILLHNIWKGEDLNESVDAFIKQSAVKKMNRKPVIYSY